VFAGVFLTRVRDIAISACLCCVITDRQVVKTAVGYAPQRVRARDQYQSNYKHGGYRSIRTEIMDLLYFLFIFLSFTQLRTGNWLLLYCLPVP
jgi:hypothetical protein